MTPFVGWSDGQLNLANLGDQIVIVDPANLVLDVVTYGTGTYSGVIAFSPPPVADTILSRDGTNTDTDDNQADFH